MCFPSLHTECLAFLLALLSLRHFCQLASAAVPGPTNIVLNVSQMIADFRNWDNTSHGQGLGYSEWPTSGGLAWSESEPYLHNYIRCYKVTKDTYWLNKLTNHFDRMLSNFGDDKGDYHNWKDSRYGYSIVSVTKEGTDNGLLLTPMAQRLAMTAGGAQVTGHQYRLSLKNNAMVEVLDITTSSVLAHHPFVSGMTLTDVPGTTLSLTGAASATNSYLITTTRGRDVAYIVHDGMITYPIALWLEIVMNDAHLTRQYQAKIQQYINTMAHDFLKKWDRFWVDTPGGGGAYVFSNDSTLEFPGAVLPHNQYLALGRTFAVMQRIDGVVGREAYRARAQKMATYFISCLRRSKNGWEWHYWDPRPSDRAPSSWAEDFSHAAIDIQFALEAYKSGLAFTREDLRRFAASYVEIMWNQSQTEPTISRYVDGSGQGNFAYDGWVELAPIDRRVWDVAWLCYQRSGSPPQANPEFLQAYEEISR